MKKVIVISGGSDGLGKVIAQNLSFDDQVIIIARNEVKLKKVSAETGCDYRVCNISDYKSCEETIKFISQKYGGIDVLINNAGVWIEGDLATNNPEEIVNTVNVNTTGTIFLTRAAVPLMSAKGRGSIINIVSLAGLNAKAKRSVYNASKWALTGFTKSLAMELAPSGIKVTGIYPGFMNTNLFRDYPSERDPEKGLNMDDVAATVKFILSRKSKTHILSVELKNIDY